MIFCFLFSVTVYCSVVLNELIKNSLEKNGEKGDEKQTNDEPSFQNL